MSARDVGYLGDSELKPPPFQINSVGKCVRNSWNYANVLNFQTFRKAVRNYRECGFTSRNEKATSNPVQAWAPYLAYF